MDAFGKAELEDILRSLEKNSARSEEMLQDVEESIRQAQAGQRRAGTGLASLEAWQERGPAKGCQVASVAGGETGEPVSLDSQGRVHIKLPWHAEEEKLLARVALPWNGTGSGWLMPPRAGQKVYVMFENGLPQSPVIIGYHPHPNNPLHYDPSSQTPEGTLAGTVDKNGEAYNPASQNKYKSYLRSATPVSGQAASEIAFVDQPGQEGLSLATQGDMHQYAAEDYYHSTAGNSVRQTGGDQHRSVGGDHHKKIGQDYTRRIEGDHKLTVSGDKRQSIDGNHHLQIPGQYSLAVTKGRSVHSVAESDSNELIILGENSLVVGQEFDLFLGLILRFWLALEDACLVRHAKYLFLNAHNCVINKDEELAKQKAAVATVKDAVTAMNDVIVGLEDSELGMTTSAAKLQTFATKINNGLVLDF